MIGFVIEFSLVLALFAWLWRAQIRDRERARRLRPSQLRLVFEADENRRKP